MYIEFCEKCFANFYDRVICGNNNSSSGSIPRLIFLLLRFKCLFNILLVIQCHDVRLFCTSIGIYLALGKIYLMHVSLQIFLAKT